MGSKLTFCGSAGRFMDDLSSRLNGLEIIPATTENAADIFPVLSGNMEFAAMSYGRPAELSDITEGIEAVPPHFPRESKIYAGLFDEGAPAAVFDLLLGYPEPDVLWLGLLEVAKPRQGGGLGRRVTHALLDTARASGFRAVQLGVMANNAPGRQFWDKMGFSQIRESIVNHQDGPDWHILVLERNLTVC